MRKLLIILLISVVVVTSTYWAHLESSPKRASEREWGRIIDALVSRSKSLEIEHYATGKRTVVDRSNPLFDRIQDFLKSSTVKKATEKTIVQETTTIHVTIPYVYGYFLTFELDDGSNLMLNLTTDENNRAVIWFETESTIYEVQANSDLLTLVEEALEN